ncbi:hypothetical protein SAMN04487895_106161 [Paenibacillus sophorae]|uniref:DoxX-like family protein n=1 Tax=Paenibacillus sophorae TaxID=1333845 RepID=A0A1H8NCB9_9BACL|nr:hypothetical protein [Paenibacillus sophorae]QWU14686.1 hypothetical protein KP014_22590 [Paenibacillus sophorae]SEO27245.1 hypothetical protein SAMN04487895_106161 [Paenibacillus sophorae]
MKKIRLAGILMLIHGSLDFSAFFMLYLPLEDVERRISFALPLFQENMRLMLMMSSIVGLCRIIGAIGVLINRKWGWVLSLINCTVTIVLMFAMLPAGVLNGLLTCSALVLLLIGRYGAEKIELTLIK